MDKFAVILAAAGSSTRFADPFVKKVFTLLGNKPIWMYSAEVFAKRRDVEQLILVIHPDDKELFNEKFAGSAAMLGIQAVLGGKERADSVLNGLREVRPELSMVAVHDAARPCVSDIWIDAVFAAGQKFGAAILATPCHATVKKSNSAQQIEQTLPRENLWLAQTPQVFRTQLLLTAYQQHAQPSAATDEASLVEAMGHPVHLVESSPLNIKVTSKADLKFAEAALKVLPKKNVLNF
ncbi:MAG: 2-C-methyl-D-erythritol 4-phosphate cytidylyltransferase [Planctomycetales bacterium]|nr:2-C-methyl-D-erythritol 4-phosphate cytidylyltransferase [Planctomycetales bacterium]